MKKLLLITGDIAAGKTMFSNILSARYGTAVFQKDTIKEILGDCIGFHNREENLRLSNATMEVMCHIFSRIAITGNNVILEANFHEPELEKLHTIACENQYDILTLVLRGDTDVLYDRYIHRMKEENRHPVHLSTTIHIKEDFVRSAERIRSEKVTGAVFEIIATDFSYQKSAEVLKRIDSFMNGMAADGTQDKGIGKQKLKSGRCSRTDLQRHKGENQRKISLKREENDDRLFTDKGKNL